MGFGKATGTFTEIKICNGHQIKSNPVETVDASNNLVDISLANFYRCAKIIATGIILPKWELRWYRGDHHRISAINDIIPAGKMISMYHKPPEKRDI